MGQTMVPGETKPMLFVAPRSSWEMLDDWGDSLGLKGSASHSVRFDGGFVDELFCLHELVMVDVDVDEPHAGLPAPRQPDVRRALAGRCSCAS